MAKMRVHELAKELDVKSQEIVNFLSVTEYAVKTAASGLEEEAVELVRRHFGKNNTPKAGERIPQKEKEISAEKEFSGKQMEIIENKKPQEEKMVSEEKKTSGDKMNQEGKKLPEGRKSEDVKKTGERPKKKSSITSVFNAQYSKQSRRQGQGNAQRQNGSGRTSGEQKPRREEVPARPENHIIRPRPVGERALRPISERTAGNEEVFEEKRPVQLQEEHTQKPQGDRPLRAQSDRPQRPQGDRPQRQQGERPQRQQGERPQRQQGDRPQRQQGDRPQRQQGDRPQRPQGDFSQRLKGQQGGFRGNNANASGSNRGNAKGRFDKELDKFNKESAAAGEELRGKESRERSANDRKNNNRRQDRDKLGSKHQENYINLEKHGGRKKPAQMPQQPKEDANEIKTITIPEKLTIRELADQMKVASSAIIKKLFLKGQMVTVNHEIDFETAEEIALEFNFICEAEEKVDVIAELLKEDDEDEGNMVSRPPVVCVMGHVDHGKTSLLDAIRSTRVTDKEAGGITQHIGASVVSINNQNITFLDTPGHEAFTAMRMRGANSTDIAILVVAADDGVMPQTVEAINHAKAAGVEIIVAVNKIDKPSANIERVKQELSEYELIPEDWGGSTIFCPVSAHTKEGIDNLLEMILLTAEVLELRANPKRNARGLVIEAQLDKGRGAVATVLVQKGTLHVGDPIACGSSYGKVRAMMDDTGCRVKEAGPSMPVEILGLNNVPDAGETFVAMDSEKEAKAFADTYISEGRTKLIEDTKAKMSLDDLFSQIQSGNMKELNIIVKADVQGSAEAVKQSLLKLSNEEVVVKVIHGGVGAINESDIILASASNAIIIGFNVRPDPIAKVTADREGVDVRLYKVIYNAIEDVEAAMKGMLDPIFEEKILGHAEIRQIFKASGVGNIAGSYILDGMFERGCKVRITREGEQIFDGSLASLKRFKDDVKEVKAGYECGLVFDGFNDIAEFDVVEAYKMVEVPR